MNDDECELKFEKNFLCQKGRKKERVKQERKRKQEAVKMKNDEDESIERIENGIE